MAMQISADGYKFDFADGVVDAFIYDNPNRADGVHGMKSVDIIAEFPNEYLFVELKKYKLERGGIEFRCPIWDKKEIVARCPVATDVRKRDLASAKRIANDLRRKYCDTFLARFAQGKNDKDVNYLCVVEGCDGAIALRMRDLVTQSIPRGIPNHSGWVRRIVKNIAVVNVSLWNSTPELSKYGTVSLI